MEQIYLRVAWNSALTAKIVDGPRKYINALAELFNGNKLACSMSDPNVTWADNYGLSAKLAHLSCFCTKGHSARALAGCCLQQPHQR